MTFRQFGEYLFAIVGFLCFVVAAFMVMIDPPHSKYDLAILGLAAMVLSQVFKKHNG